EEAAVRQAIIGYRPEQLGLGGTLWTTRKVNEFLHRHFGVRFSHGGLCKLMDRMGLSFQRPDRRAREVDPAAIEERTPTAYPALRVRRPAAGHKDRDRFISGKSKQNAVKTMVLTDSDGRMLFCSPARPGSCADITHARQLGPVKLLADGPAVEILADAGYQGLGAQSGGRVVTPSHRKFKMNAPDWYEEMCQRQRKAHSSMRIRVEHGIAHLKNWGSWPATSAAATTSATPSKLSPDCCPTSGPRT
ncbi:transposase family protein, partial [Streptomyces calidiresistens]